MLYYSFLIVNIQQFGNR